MFNLFRSGLIAMKNNDFAAARIALGQAEDRAVTAACLPKNYYSVAPYYTMTGLIRGAKRSLDTASLPGATLIPNYVFTRWQDQADHLEKIILAS